jgi:hypothetical protein
LTKKPESDSETLTKLESLALLINVLDPSDPSIWRRQGRGANAGQSCPRSSWQPLLADLQDGCPALKFD